MFVPPAPPKNKTLSRPPIPCRGRARSRRFRATGVPAHLFPEKVGVGISPDPWLIGHTYAKSLIVEAVPPTGCVRISTGRPCLSTGRPSFSTGPFSADFGQRRPFLTYLSLFKEKKKKKKRETHASAIHGSEEQAEFVTTGSKAIHGSTRGYPWIAFRRRLRHLPSFWHPIHGFRPGNALPPPEVLPEVGEFAPGKCRFEAAP